MLNKFTQYIRQKVSSDEGWFSPYSDPNDIYVVSYPRSGNTLLRFALAEARCGRTLTVKELDRLTIDLFQSSPFTFPATDRLIKWHGYPSSHKVEGRYIYIERDEKSVARSLYTYMRFRHRLFHGTAEDFVHQFSESGFPVFGNYELHKKLWAVRLEASESICIEFDDLVARDPATIDLVASFTSVSSDKLIKSISTKRSFKNRKGADFFLSTEGHSEFDSAWKKLRS